jgi:hypothetical protein
VLIRLVKPQDSGWQQTIGPALDYDIAAWQVCGELGPRGLAWHGPPAMPSGPVADATDQILTGVDLQPFQILFLTEAASRLNEARPDLWRRKVASYLGDRVVHDVMRRGTETVEHAVAVAFAVAELWQRVGALPKEFGYGNVVFVPTGFSVDALLGILLDGKALDPHYFIVRGHFDTTVAAVVPAGGLVMRLWAMDDAQVDLLGPTELIEALAHPTAP